MTYSPLSLLIRIAALPKKAVHPALKLAVALSAEERLLEHEAPRTLKMSAAAWDAVRDDLAGLFRFSAGTITMPPDHGIDPFDILTLQSELRLQTRSADKPRGRGRTKLEPQPGENRYPTNPHVLGLIDFGMAVGEAKAFATHIVRTYGEWYLEQSLIAARRKDPPPISIKNYIVAIIKNTIEKAKQEAPQHKTTLGAKRVKRLLKQANPEAAQTEFIGWEAPARSQDGAVTYPAGTRRQVFRMRTGRIEFVMPKPGTAVPRADEDPGVIIED